MRGLKPLKCDRCGESLYPQRYTENGVNYVDGLECINCFNRVVTSVMTAAEYRVLLEQNERL